tara:strand:- start:8543 stop:8716 length:174 start_codon:yes stop_codon:yes gene_type:complete
MKQAIEFEETPRIKDVINALKEAEKQGFTKFNPALVSGDYKSIDIPKKENILRIYLL